MLCYLVIINYVRPLKDLTTVCVQVLYEWKTQNAVHIQIVDIPSITTHIVACRLNDSWNGKVKLYT